jgi:hypothetical protein
MPTPVAVPTRRFHEATVLDAARFQSYASEGLAEVPTMILCETRGLQLFWVIRGAVTWKSVEVTVRRRRSRPDLISHDEYPRSYSGKATTCRKRSVAQRRRCPSPLSRALFHNALTRQSKRVMAWFRHLSVRRRQQSPHWSALEDFRLTTWVVLGSTLTCSPMSVWRSGKSRAKYPWSALGGLANNRYSPGITPAILY